MRLLEELAGEQKPLSSFLEPARFLYWSSRDSTWLTIKAAP